MRKYLSSISQIRYIFLLAILLLNSLPSSVFAVPAVDPFTDYMQNNNILFYDPSGSGACTTVGQKYSKDLDLPSLTGNDNAEKIWNFLIDEGLSDEQAAGIMGNIHQESGYDPNLQEGNGIGYGIVQWSYDRRTALQDAADLANVPVSDLGFQLGYMMYELKTMPLINWRNLFERYNAWSKDNLWDLIKEQDTIEDSVIVFHDGFERSGDYDSPVYKGIQHRVDFAEQAYEKFSGKSASGGSASSANCQTQSAAGSGDLQALVLEYAWPNYHPAQWLEMMPAYAAAVKKGQQDGKNVGGGIYPGIDCAGFVNLLITDSGFEPSYNYDGKGNDNAGATGEAQHRTWMKENWTYIGRGGSPEVDVAKLQPGDVAVSREEVSNRVQHIFIHVGKIDKFNNIYASASYLLWRTPMAAGDFENNVDSDYDWYRKS